MFAEKPEEVMTMGSPVGVMDGVPFGPLTIAVSLWRYVEYFHSYLPSIHDVVVGTWQPNGAELAAGLKPNDYCTIASIIQAQVDFAKDTP